MKTLIDKLRKVGKGFKRGLLVATAVASLGVASCKLCPDPEPINYAPEITSTPTTTQVDEGNSYNYDVDATDADGDKLTYSLPIAPNWLSINSNTGMISGTAPQVDSDTPCDIEVGVSDGVNPTATQNYTLTVKNIVVPPVDDYLDISGKLEDCESDTGKQGRIKIYDSLENYIGETTTDSSGNFSFHSDTKKATDLSNVVLRAISTDASSNQNSYVRTVTANVNSASEPDVTVNPIRVVPYPIYSNPSFNASVEDFKQHMRETNGVNITKWNLNELKGIGIFTTNPQNPLNGSFDLNQINIIKDKISSSSDIKLYIEGKKDLVGINPPLDEMLEGDGITPQIGYIVVVPDNTIPAAGKAVINPDALSTGIINRAIIYITPLYVAEGNPTVSHEFGHVFIAPNGEATTLSNTLTIMVGGNQYLSLPGPADVKSAKIVYENTYLPREKLDDILGTITF